MAAMWRLADQISKRLVAFMFLSEGRHARHKNLRTKDRMGLENWRGGGRVSPRR